LDRPPCLVAFWEDDALPFVDFGPPPLFFSTPEYRHTPVARGPAKPS
jgi:hypothetical protein